MAFEQERTQLTRPGTAPQVTRHPSQRMPREKDLSLRLAAQQAEPGDLHFDLRRQRTAPRRIHSLAAEERFRRAKRNARWELVPRGPARFVELMQLRPVLEELQPKPAGVQAAARASRQGALPAAFQVPRREGRAGLLRGFLTRIRTWMAGQGHSRAVPGMGQIPHPLITPRRERLDCLYRDKPDQKERGFARQGHL